MADFSLFGRGSERADAPLPDRFESVKSALLKNDLKSLETIVCEVASARCELDVILWLELCQCAFKEESSLLKTPIFQMMNRVSGYCPSHERIACQSPSLR